MASGPIIRVSLITLLVLGVVPALNTETWSASGAPCMLGETLRATRPRSLAAAAVIPFGFVPNAGQLDARVRYHARGPGYGLYFTSDDIVMVLSGQRPPARDRRAILPVSLASSSRDTAPDPRDLALRLRFVGANPDARVEARDETGARVNYAVGDAAGWRHGLPLYRELVYRDLWPGIDLALRGADGRLKYEFHVRPGASPGVIRLVYRGADTLATDEAGRLLVRTPLGVLADERPTSYQEIGGRRVPVPSRFVTESPASGEGGYRFEVGDYDARHPLVIDPGLAYSTFLGGNRNDVPFAIAVDSLGNAYVTGLTVSTNFPTTTERPFAGFCDVFVAKLDAAGSRLLYATYLGGSGCDRGNSIAVDAAGNAYVGGETPSINFPTTAGAFAGARAGSTDGFLAKLDSSGALLYGTYLGGTGFDTVTGVALDAEGKVYVAGTTRSVNFPTTPGAFDRTCGTDGNCNPRFGFGQSDAFVAKFDLAAAGPAALVYSTYLGGSANEGFGVAIAVDGLGQAYVTGRTDSPDFPTTENAFDRTYNSPPGDFFRGGDAFVTKLDATGSQLLYSTFLGGGGTDGEGGGGIAVDWQGGVYVRGGVISTNCCLPPFLSDFPTTEGAFDRTFNGFTDGFVAKLDTTRAGPASLVFSTFLGGTGSDGLVLSGTTGSLAVDGAGNLYVTGGASTLDFPTTPGAFARSLAGASAGGDDAFVVKLDPTGSRLLYGTYFGGGCGLFGFNGDSGVGIAVDPKGNAYVTGIANASTFPTTPGAFDRTINSLGFQGSDAFVAKLATTPQGQLEVVITDVSRLAAAGALSSGQANALIAHLETAIQQLNGGKTDAAINALASFTNEVQALVRTEVLTPAQGDPLIDDVREITSFITYLAG